MQKTWWGTEKNPTVQMRSELIAVSKIFNRNRACYITDVSWWDHPFWIHTTDLMPPKRVEGSNDNMSWHFAFYMTEEDGKRSKEYEVRVDYQPEHPFEAPISTVISGLTSRDPYQHGYWTKDGVQPCLYHGGRSVGWDPNHSTAATIALWTVQWLRACAHYKKTSTWPDAS